MELSTDQRTASVDAVVENCNIGFSNALTISTPSRQRKSHFKRYGYMGNQNKCERCGAASYKPVIGRDESGAMKPTGEYQCVGCGLKFKDLDEWRLGPRKQSHDQQGFEHRRQ